MKIKRIFYIFKHYPYTRTVVCIHYYSNIIPVFSDEQNKAFKKCIDIIYSQLVYAYSLRHTSSVSQILSTLVFVVLCLLFVHLFNNFKFVS